MIKTSYEIEQDKPDYVLLNDTTVRDGGRSITNGAEEVITELAEQGVLTPGKKVFYRDSDGQIDELLYKHNKGEFCFHGFKSGHEGFDF